MADALSRMTMCSLSHIDEAKNYLVRDVHKLARLGVRLEDSLNRESIVYHKSESSLVVKVNSKKHLDKPLMELNESVLDKLNESFSLGRDGVLRYQGKLWVPDVDEWRDWILEQAHGSRYSIHLGWIKMYHDLREIYWWEGIKKDIVEFVGKCPNRLQLKAEHQK